MSKMKTLAMVALCEVSVSDPAVGKIEADESLSSRKGGRAPRVKGNRAERAIVKFLQDRGFGAERVPLSGAAGGSYRGDLTVPILNVDRVVEVKVRADGFRELYGCANARRPPLASSV